MFSVCGLREQFFLKRKSPFRRGIPGIYHPPAAAWLFATHGGTVSLCVRRQESYVLSPYISS